ncbi:random septum position protein, DNAJ domain protein Rsp1 [Schizosaccharomyces osmophilus]|uniref:Random septum position protein, DNAJ domain protein Rsp1 n=1 Tax=Schizosaccharomyces osmophilus TaxID=2545709 RepID=A0AAE9WAP3_9SCHI|nr:random septum position protein, DNAJ domain protein Rsp1 [Schizosaccharomyces osmophilus]WBW72806.1 random septum position protein, DNAJ domain protein Rsp1 [Schizosaccharomyces osmophilus]
MTRPAFSEEFVDYYDVLGIESTSDYVQIRQQYLKLVLRFHPDRNPGREQDVIPHFQLIQRAHEVLRDGKLRELYDQKRLLEFGRLDGLSRFRPKKTDYTSPNRKGPNVTSKVSTKVSEYFSRNKKKGDLGNEQAHGSPYRPFSSAERQRYSSSYSTRSPISSPIPVISHEDQKGLYSSSNNNSHERNPANNANVNNRFQPLSKFEAKLYLESLREKRRSFSSTPKSDNTSYTRSPTSTSSPHSVFTHSNQEKPSLHQEPPQSPESFSISLNSLSPSPRLPQHYKRDLRHHRPTSIATDFRSISSYNPDHIAFGKIEEIQDDSLQPPNSANSVSSSTEYHNELQKVLRSLEREEEFEDEITQLLPNPPSFPQIKAPVPPLLPTDISNETIDKYFHDFEVYQKKWSSYSLIYTQFLFHWQIFKNKCFQLDLMNTPGHTRLLHNWQEGTQNTREFLSFEEMHYTAISDLMSFKESLFSSLNL